MIAWVDASAGVSGDMLLGAMVDLGVPIPELQRALDRLGLPIVLEHSVVMRGGMRAVKVDVRTSGTSGHRHLSDVLELLASLDEPVRQRAAAVFHRLAEAEARTHGIPPDAVHFHEVGALDSIADVVGFAVSMEVLGRPTVCASAVGLGAGRAVTQHGSIPVPVPAVLELLTGAPVCTGPASFESTTPTGAALLASEVVTWGPVPDLRLTAVGVGAGSADPDGWPNVVRIVLGDPTDAIDTADTTPGQAWQLETNIDDMDPRLWPEVQCRLLEAGASDAWVTPIVMKKGRPAHTLSALCGSDRLEDVREAIYRETTTIGLRQIKVGKHALDRTWHSVAVDGHHISVKVASRDGVAVNASVEWEDVVAAATALGRPAASVLEQAKSLVTHSLEMPQRRADRQ